MQLVEKRQDQSSQGCGLDFYHTGLYYACKYSTILNAISYAPHILLMTAEVNESQFPKFSFQFIWHWSHNNTFKRKLFCRIPVFFTIPWDLSLG